MYLDHNVEIDMILLHFSKAFDTVSHCHLFKNSSFTVWKVMLSAGWKNGVQHSVSISSGVPQGSVLMLLIYINDIMRTYLLS